MSQPTSLLVAKVQNDLKENMEILDISNVDEAIQLINELKN